MLIKILILSAAVWAQTNYNGDREPAHRQAAQQPARGIASEEAVDAIDSANAAVNGRGFTTAQAKSQEPRTKKKELTREERNKAIVDEALHLDQTKDGADSSVSH